VERKDHPDLQHLNERIDALEERLQHGMEEVLEEIARLGNRIEEIENALEVVMSQRLE
jgi:tetrahydromethanopterin S-methyltransferase subunit G